MNRTIKIAVLLLLAMPGGLFAQKWFSRDAKVYFDATTKNSPERIEATNKSGTIVVEQSSGRVEASVLIKGFLFDKSLMQEHFNENYMESSKFPKASFKGKIDNLSAVNFGQDGTYNAQISGDLTMHGVTKPVKTTATFKVKGGKISTSANFNVTLSDFGIDVPSVVADKLAKEAKISFAGDLAKMN
ncbi:MAG TPA: YceI family protein [Saprospiraceae bacterium]|nr:YceI family protein [Saprospiraceae bacterium]